MFKLYSPLTLDFDTTRTMTVITARGLAVRVDCDMSGDWYINEDAPADLIGECGELIAGLEALSRLDEGEMLTPDRVAAGTLRIESSIAEPDEIIAEALGITYRVMLEDDVWAARHTSWATPVAQDVDLAALLFRLLEEAAEFGREAAPITATEVSCRASASQINAAHRADLLWTKVGKSEYMRTDGLTIRKTERAWHIYLADGLAAAYTTQDGRVLEGIHASGHNLLWAKLEAGHMAADGPAYVPMRRR